MCNTIMYCYAKCNIVLSTIVLHAILATAVAESGFGRRDELLPTILPRLAPLQQPCDRTRRVFTEPHGEISDGPAGSNYTQDSHCEWLIRAMNSSQFITLTFHSMGTECSYDYIFVYDGDSFRSPLLGSFSGKTEPQQLMAKSGNMLILLYSDTNYVLDGFKAEYTISNCPNNCMKRGKCINHKCVCHGNWVGQDCRQDACPEMCGASEGRGICSRDHCQCMPGYSGRSCSLSKDNSPGNKWHWLSTVDDGLSPRAAHTAVYVNSTDSLYVFGGYNLNNILGSLQIYHFAKNVWQDEWGKSLLRPVSSEIDNTLLKEVFHQDGADVQQWGLGKEASLFKNILLSISDSGNFLRKQRSPPDIGEMLRQVIDKLRPSPRYGHAACALDNGFVMYGGKLESGRLSDELWMYSIANNERQWTLHAQNSTFRPPPLIRHTLTIADRFLYLFGGSTEDGEFSSRLFRIPLPAPNVTDVVEQWEEILPHGGKVLDVRVVAHTTVFHHATNSLIVYGGILAGVARFSKLSERMFAFHVEQRYWTEILYPRTPLRDAHVPRERAFHTTTIVGNYLLVFGGYTHRHNKEEICYDNQMYLYHIGCHTWINQNVLGSAVGGKYPKIQGVFAHATALRNRRTLLLVGGYHGNVNGDLLAYTLPAMLVVTDESLFDPESICHTHHSATECLSDPECGWCSADNVCYGRTIGANCTTNLQTTRCPGICPALGDCHSCLVHGSQNTTSRGAYSISHKFGLGQCTWCVQNARCHHKLDNFGICGEETPSHAPGWWGTKGTEVYRADECTAHDHRPGLTFIKYLNPVNWTQPDQVTIVNATMVDFNVPSTSTNTEQKFRGDMMGRLLGFIRLPSTWTGGGEVLRVCASYSQAVLHMTSVAGIRSIAANITAEQTQCVLAQWPNLESPPTTRTLIDFQAYRTLKMTGNHQHSKMGLQHNKHHENAKAFTFEYLEPYSNGSCRSYSNCLHCLTDSLCGWCDITRECVDRQTAGDEQKTCARDGEWRFLTLQPSHCANCSNYIGCETCIETELCEWWIDDARCARRGRSPDAVRIASNCPAPCYARRNCSACLDERGRCVWCATTQQCFSFSVYTSEYQFGLCREWLDQTVPLVVDSDETITALVGRQQCRSCGIHTNCSTCLRSLSCGWCFNRTNPIEGVCMQGDFNRSTEMCGGHDDSHHEWAYAQCPDVDECGLDLHDCHSDAQCTNTHGSYHCQCRKGFIGDGHKNCSQTCFETCEHGECTGGPDYKCDCYLGWTGKDCSSNCGCNFHSHCHKRIGECDRCLNWTEGKFCEKCKAGSYGNATSATGCTPCECNGHGNQALGICDGITGECYCQDNTKGLNCDMCNQDFYGDPKDGGQCYFQCVARGMLAKMEQQGIGSYQAYRPKWGTTNPALETRECLWIINPHNATDAPVLNSLIQLTIQKKDLNVSCSENAVYVYDGLPDLIENSKHSQLLAVFCTEDATETVVEARSGQMSVHFRLGNSGQGFNALYAVKSCATNTCLAPHICDAKGRCVCPEGNVGPYCVEKRCPQNCHSQVRQGLCDNAYGRCICQADYGGVDCGVRIMNRHIVVTELFNTALVSDQLEHLRNTLPRFGHSLVADKRGSLWMFGGYSLSHGPLNDIRQFDTKNNTWMQVTVDSTPDAKMPRGRYFHAAAIVNSCQTIFVYGGLTDKRGNVNVVLEDFWKFIVHNQRWEEIRTGEGNVIWPPPLAGHTLTLVKDGDRESLLLIGGLSIVNGLQNEIWEFTLSTKRWERLMATGSGPAGIYGHSTIFHSQDEVLYVFGGIQSIQNRMQMSSKLFALNYGKMRWTELPPFSQLLKPGEILPHPRFLHSAVATDTHMLIFGGVTPTKTESLLMYMFKCSQWLRLTDHSEFVGDIPTRTYGQAMVRDPDNDTTAYIVGGWDGSAQSRVNRIILPSDICHLWNRNKTYCLNFIGCSHCAVQEWGDAGSHCYSNNKFTQNDLCDPYNGTVLSKAGVVCNSAWIGQRDCTAFKTCTACLAAWPAHVESAPVCQWCEGCDSVTRCVAAGGECDTDRKCGSRQISIGLIGQCPELQCAATDCESCQTLEGCSWNVTECILTSGDGPPAICPPRCNTHSNCTECLTTVSSEGGWPECGWATKLNECISMSYQPLYCTGGICGLILHGNNLNLCPEPCGAYTQCATCLRHSNCGWCTRSETEGDGVCTEGSLEGPSKYSASSTCNIVYAAKHNLSSIDSGEPYDWHYVQCPPENECKNQHHSCDSRSERCVDMDNGYSCECAIGYSKFEDGTSDCMPVCTQGCLRGTCVQPNVCECDFGYVGGNCSIQCQCNGHSDCRGADRLNDCIECYNNTIGDQCERCKPLYVGDPHNNGECVPCLDYCNGHSDVCVSKMAEQPVKNMSREELESYLKEGVRGDAVCLQCGNQTAGDRCETCNAGHFRGSLNHRDMCRPCECHGHGETCDPVTGEKCNCGNNTESDATCSANSSKNSAQLCWMVQCSKCRDSYAGNPVDGHQCYKQITIESRMCFDAKTIDECKIKPHPLKPGQTVFFVVQPRFMNVDIRIIVDVTQGELDLFMSPQEDSFIVHTNQTSGQQQIHLDSRYRWMGRYGSKMLAPLDISPPRRDPNDANATFEDKMFWTPHIHDCRSLSSSAFYVRDKKAKDLSTYVTLHHCNTLLRVFGLRNRLVLTLPQNAHNLSATKFYIALRASAGIAASYGLVFFRQDQLHIDLFVFFSVFFSCFFLFLAICVVVWKAKQAADLRRARRRHVVEMLHMAKRPFATVSLSMSASTETPNRRRMRHVKINASSGGDLRPIAIEPTADGVAAVGTVFVRLPGQMRAPVTLALGSSLLTFPLRPSAATSRAFMRRRGSAGAPTN